MSGGLLGENRSQSTYLGDARQMAEVSRKISDFGKTFFFFFLSKVERRFGVAAGTYNVRDKCGKTDRQNRKCEKVR